MKAQFLNNKELIEKFNEELFNKDEAFFSKRELDYSQAKKINKVVFLERVLKNKFNVEFEMSKYAYPTELSYWFSFKEAAVLSIQYSDTTDSKKSVELVVNYLENVPYRNRIKKESRQILEDKIAIYEEQLAQFDTLDEQVKNEPIESIGSTILAKTTLKLGLKEAKTQLKNLENISLVFAGPINQGIEFNYISVLLFGFILAFLYLLIVAIFKL